LELDLDQVHAQLAEATNSLGTTGKQLSLVRLCATVAQFPLELIVSVRDLPV